MRLATIASIGVIAASTAALAQVASTPVEQKVPTAGQSNVTGDVPSADASATNNMVANTTAPPANDMAPAMPGEKKTPSRRR